MNTIEYGKGKSSDGSEIDRPSSEGKHNKINADESVVEPDTDKKNKNGGGDPKKQILKSHR